MLSIFDSKLREASTYVCHATWSSVVMSQIIVSASVDEATALLPDCTPYASRLHYFEPSKNSAYLARF